MYKNFIVVVISPAFNEENTIEEVINSIPTYVDEIIVIDDGSTDRTAEKAKKNGATVIHHKKNFGVGASFHTGIREALESDADIMVNIDADGQFNPNDITKLIDPIVDNEADFVSGSRFIDKNFYPKMSKVKFLGNQFMSFFISKICGKKFYDVSCGFRAYSKEALLKLNLFGEFTYTQETFLNLSIRNIPIMEIPIEVKGIRQYGRSRVASNLFKYSFRSLKVILRSFRDYWPFKLFALISLIFFVFSFSFGAFLLIHYLKVGAFSPHKWAGFSAGFFFLLSLLTLAIGFILDMFSRMRLNQEEILYYLKRMLYKKRTKSYPPYSGDENL